MLYDKVRIYVEAGRGGDGCMSFRRESKVPKGGPDGGDGGHGGSVILVADPNLRDLSKFRHSKHCQAKAGVHGSGNQRSGARGEDVLISVPVGTTVASESGDLSVDLAAEGESVTVASGGLGGRGNKHFTTATRQAPRFAEKGLPGDGRWIDLQLKLLSDVGLIGKPNAGKSSLLRALSNAKPEVADYPFTTKEPILGTLDYLDRQLVVADIPGLIEGAAGGAGMGHDFLAHVERTKVLVHVVDIAPVDGSEPFANYETIKEELKQYGQGLAQRPVLVALNKTDLIAPDDLESVVAPLKSKLEAEVVDVIPISAATGSGIQALKERLFSTELTEAEPASSGGRDHKPASYRLYRPIDPEAVTVEAAESGLFVVGGDRVERLVARTDLENEEALEYMEHRLRRIGVVDELEKVGFKSGDEVSIAGVSFNLFT